MISDRNNHIVNSLLVLLIATGTYIFSYWIFGYYTQGDQRYYISLYEDIRGAPLSYINNIQFKHTGSREPLFGVLMWIFSAITDKKIAISLANSALSCSLFIFLKKSKAKIPFIILSFTNYYLLVLFTSAERLKFAYLFAILSLIISSRSWRAIAAISSLLSHFSIIIVFSSIILPRRYHDAIRSLRLGGLEAAKSSLILISTCAAILIFGYIYRVPLMEKFGHYASNDIKDIGSVILLFIIASLATRSPQKMVMVFLIPIICTFIFGGNRVNMLSITVFLYVIAQAKKTGHLAVLLVMAYLSFKSIGFIQDILAYGTGFKTW